MANAPQVALGLGLFWDGFWDLIDDRLSERSPIPWSTIQAYAVAKEFDEDQAFSLHYHVKAMDLEFRRFVQTKGKRGRRPERNEDDDVHGVRRTHARYRRKGGGEREPEEEGNRPGG
jgi:hypothetical protein